MRGELVMLLPVGYEHGSVAGRIPVALGEFVAATKLGDVLGAELGFLIARDPDTTRPARLR